MIKVSNIHKSFGKVEVLKGVDLTINKSEVVSIVGASGAGKSTLLQIIGTLDKANSGSVVIDNLDISMLSQKKIADFRNHKIGFVFQFHHLQHDGRYYLIFLVLYQVKPFENNMFLYVHYNTEHLY